MVVMVVVLLLVVAMGGHVALELVVVHVVQVLVGTRRLAVKTKEGSKHKEQKKRRKTMSGA